MKRLLEGSKIGLIAMSLLMTFFFVSCAGQNESDLFDETLKASMDEEVGESIEDVEEIVAENDEEAVEEEGVGLDDALAKLDSGDEGEELEAAEDAEEDSEEMAELLSDEGEEESSLVASNEEPEFEEDLAAPTGLESDSAMVETNDGIETIAPAATPAPVKRRVAKSRTPEIGNDAFVVDGKTLNRFYFVRNGDTAESVTKLIYGDGGVQENLVAANGSPADFKPGTAVFYNSPNKPEDAKMRSFYYERTVKPETYTVQKGDTLAEIAKGAYGDAASWKEIAVVNQLKSPSDLEEGQLLALAPKSLSDYTHEKFASAAILDEPVNISEDVKPTNVALEDIEKAKAEFAKTEIERNEAQQASAGIGGFLRQNWLFLGVVFTIGLAAFFFLVVLPRRSGY